MESYDDTLVIQRLKEFVTNSGLTVTQFADKCGIPRPSFSQMLSGRNRTINSQVLVKLNAAFPQLDIMWLLLGSNAVRKDVNIQMSEPQNPQDGVAGQQQTTVNQLQQVFVTCEDCAKDSVQSEQKLHKPCDKSPEPDHSVAAEWAASVICIPPSDVKTDSANAKSAGYDASQITASTSSAKRSIKSIIIFYSDNSFESFTPSI